MRFNRIVFTAVVALVTVSAATEHRHATVSNVAWHEAAQPLRGANSHSYKRLLRFNEADGGNGDLDSTNEDRSVNVGALTQQLSKLESFKGLRNVDDLLTSAQSPKASKLEQELMAKVNSNSLAKKYASQFIKDDWELAILKNKLRITPTTAVGTQEYQAYQLLLRLREYNEFAKTPDIGQKLLLKVTNDDLAKQFFGRFVDEQWSPQTLKLMMGITSNTAAGSKELTAYSTLLQSRMYFDTLLKSTTPSMSKMGEDILMKVNKNPIAQKYFGQYMDGTLTQTTLMQALGVTRYTSKSSKEFQAVAILIRASTFNKRFSVTPTMQDKLFDAVSNNKLASSLYNQYSKEKWTLATLKKEIGFLRNSATPNEYAAFEALVLTRLYTETIAKAKTPTARKQGQDLMTKLENDVTAQKYFAEFLSDGLTLNGLKVKLGVTRETSQKSKEYQTLLLLMKARATANSLDRIKRVYV